MKIRLFFLLCALSGASTAQPLPTPSFAALLTGPGGLETLAPLTIEFFGEQGELLRQIRLPDSGPDRILGHVTADVISGLMTLSGDGRYLIVPGYTDSRTVRIARIDLNGEGVPETVATAPNFFSSSDGRVISAASRDGRDVWFSTSDAGPAGTLSYLPSGGTSPVRISQPPGEPADTSFGGIEAKPDRLCVFVGQTAPVSSRWHCYNGYPAAPVRIHNNGSIDPVSSSYALAWSGQGVYSAYNTFVRKSANAFLGLGDYRTCGVAALDTPSGVVVMATGSKLSGSRAFRYLDTTGPTGVVNVPIGTVRQAPANTTYKAIKLIQRPDRIFADGFALATGAATG